MNPNSPTPDNPPLTETNLSWWLAPGSVQAESAAQGAVIANFQASFSRRSTNTGRTSRTSDPPGAPTRICQRCVANATSPATSTVAGSVEISGRWAINWARTSRIAPRPLITVEWGHEARFVRQQRSSCIQPTKQDRRAKCSGGSLWRIGPNFHYRCHGTCLNSAGFTGDSGAGSR